MQENRTWRFGVLVIVDWSWIVQIYFGSKLFVWINGRLHVPKEDAS